jgi:hypothetical protein
LVELFESCDVARTCEIQTSMKVFNPLRPELNPSAICWHY